MCCALIFGYTKVQTKDGPKVELNFSTDDPNVVKDVPAIINSINGPAKKPSLLAGGIRDTILLTPIKVLYSVIRGLVRPLISKLISENHQPV
jgi:hypothetical protein